VILTPKRTADDELVVSMSTEVKGLDIYYAFDNTNPDPFYPRYDGTPVKFPLGATQLNVITYRNGHPIGQQVNIKKDVLAKRVDEGRHIY
jgi:hexosaminidase